jgi:hypothetical protein
MDKAGKVLSENLLGSSTSGGLSREGGEGDTQERSSVRPSSILRTGKSGPAPTPKRFVYGTGEVGEGGTGAV